MDIESPGSLERQSESMVLGQSPQNTNPFTSEIATQYCNQPISTNSVDINSLRRLSVPSDI